MFSVFNFIGSIFGYVLWAIFYVFQNFGIAIIIFTIITRLLIFPSSIKQQKSMAANARMQAKQKEIREKYANNKAKQNEEIQKLYEREGVSPMSGCLTSLFPMFIMLGIYYSVVRPLSNVIHITSAKMTDLINFINGIPGVNVTSTNIYHEMDILRLFNNPSSMEILNNHGAGISSVLSQGEIAEIQGLAGGFRFLGLNLLDIPNSFELLSNVIIIIPILVFITSIGSQLLTMRIQGNAMMNQQQGCMKYMMLGLPLISVYISYIVPGAVGFYWIWSTIIGFVQTVIISKMYSPLTITAKSEAQHVALMEIKEAQVPYHYVPRTAHSAQNTKKKKK
jgi:YidC/Oxa1 family membrane protein insertase